MAKWTRRLISEGTYQAIGGLISWLLGLPMVTGVIAAVTAYFGNWPWLAIYLATLGAFALGCAIALMLSEIVRRLAIFRLVSLVDVLPHHAVMNAGTINNLSVRGVVENRSQRDVFALSKRAQCAIQNRTQADIQFPTEPILIGAGKKQSFNFPPISGIDATKEARGYVEIELFYGPVRDDQRFVYESKCEIVLLLSEPESGKVDIKVANAVRHESHTKR